MLNKFTWNDLVFIKKNSPPQFHPGEYGVICGMSKIEFDGVAQKYHANINDSLYTVEFKNGSSISIPEHYLEKADDT